jgi:ABC-type sugar transport system ATPase subunit
VDVAAKEEIHERIFQLAASGVAVIVISSELPEIMKVSDRILIMHEGQVAAILNRAAATSEALLRAATGERHEYARAPA